MSEIANLMKQRPYRYSEVFEHAPIPVETVQAVTAHDAPVDPEQLALLGTIKNESNCTVSWEDGTWLTTWGQGAYENSPDERIVGAISEDEGKTWTEPFVVHQSDMANNESSPYGIPFIVPGEERVYVFFFRELVTDGAHWAKTGQRGPIKYPEHYSAVLCFCYSDDRGKTWSGDFEIKLPSRDIHVIPGRIHGWLNHPPQVMPTGEVIFTFSGNPSFNARAWQLTPAEANIVRCDNILTERDPERLTFTLLPEGPRGIRTDVLHYRENSALNRLMDEYDGAIEDTGYSIQELTVIALENGNWMGVGRCNLGSPAYTISRDTGQTWSPARQLCYRPGGEPIHHPMTMCPIRKLASGEIVLLFTNNDGSERGATHVWSPGTRNPQWMVVGKELEPGDENGGIVFGEPQVIAEVDESYEVKKKLGISMPQCFQANGRTFICYNINKEHILLDRIPAELLSEMAPSPRPAEEKQ